MKAVVVEIRGRSAAVLSRDGCIKKVQNENFAIGQVIEMKEKTSFKAGKLKVWAAAAAALIILVGGTSALASAPYSYVSVDVNPSIELTLNLFDRVISVEAVNEDGAEVLSRIDVNKLNNQNINDAITKIITEISNEGYFERGEGGIIIAAASKNRSKADSLAEDIYNTVNNDLNDEESPAPTPEASETPGTTLDPVEPTVTPEPDGDGDEGEEGGEGIKIEVISVGYERVQQARALGVTPGKLNLVQKLQVSTPDIEDDYVTEEWISKSVQEIQAEIKANRKALKFGTDDGEEAPDQDEDQSGEMAQDIEIELETRSEQQKNGKGSNGSNGNKGNNGNGNNGNKGNNGNGNNGNKGSNGNGNNGNGNNGNKSNNGNGKGNNGA
ncbi:MAG: Anti-sigma-I factor RsgI [Firmicutes bacterium ADurb.Bin182]|nr:MAG: Anti-sigma-I factor RsgI [Firmicutes bacterium ADurb.Bin182]